MKPRIAPASSPFASSSRTPSSVARLRVGQGFSQPGAGWQGCCRRVMPALSNVIKDLQWKVFRKPKSRPT